MFGLDRGLAAPGSSKMLIYVFYIMPFNTVHKAHAWALTRILYVGEAI